MMVLSSGTSQGNMSSSLITPCCSMSAVTFCSENGVALMVEQYLNPSTSQSTCWSLMYERIKGINRASSWGRFSKVSSKMSSTLLGSRLKYPARTIAFCISLRYCQIVCSSCIFKHIIIFILIVLTV